MFEQNQFFQGYGQQSGAYGNTDTRCCCICVNAIPPIEDCLNVKLIATVYIPDGFVTAGEDFLTILNIDESSLSVNTITDTQIGIKGKNTCAKEVVTLDGSFTYNVVLDGFTPAIAVPDENLYPYTAFTYTEEIPVWKVLGVSLYEYNIAINYNLVAEQGVPFIVDCNGKVIYKNSNMQAFMRLLNNPDMSKTVNVPYRISIHPYSGGSCNSSSCGPVA